MDEHEDVGTRPDAPHEGTSPSAPKAPDAAGVNEAWGVEPETPQGIRGLVYRLVSRLLHHRFDAQRTFNSEQVRLDNALLQHLEAREAATHAHYDRILGVHGRHMEEIDERHVALQKELVAQFVDLDRRLDLVRDVTDRGRLSLEHELKRLRRRVASLGESRPPGC